MSAVSESRHPDDRRNWSVVNARRATGRTATQTGVSRYQMEQAKRLTRLYPSQAQCDEFRRRVMSGELELSKAIKEAEKALLLELSEKQRANYCDRKAGRRIRSLWKRMLKAASELGTIPAEAVPMTVLEVLLNQPECQNPDTLQWLKAIIEAYERRQKEARG
jgi:hypothetical protein